MKIFAIVSNTFDKARKHLRRWEFRHVTRWRLELGEHELMNLVPFFKRRVADALAMLSEVSGACDFNRNDDGFGDAYLQLIDPTGAGRESGKIRRTNEEAAAEYFDQIKAITQRTTQIGIDAQNDLMKVVDIATFSQAIASTSYFCSVLENSGDSAFAARPIAFFTATNLKTGKVFSRSNIELEILNFPFRAISENLAMLGKTTRESAENWVHEQLKWKTRHLTISEHRWAVVLNLVTIATAVTLSWLFLTFNDPYKVMVTERANERLNEQVGKLATEMGRKDVDIQSLNSKVSALGDSLQTCESKKE